MFFVVFFFVTRLLCCKHAVFAHCRTTCNSFRHLALKLCIHDYTVDVMHCDVRVQAHGCHVLHTCKQNISETPQLEHTEEDQLNVNVL